MKKQDKGKVAERSLEELRLDFKYQYGKEGLDIYNNYLQDAAFELILEWINKQKIEGKK